MALRITSIFALEMFVIVLMKVAHCKGNLAAFKKLNFIKGHMT